MTPPPNAGAKPTMADVARRAGVSKMTVSRVINDRPGVSPESLKRVTEAIRALDYVPSRRARSLATGTTELIGMIVLDVVSEWVWSLVMGAGAEAERHGRQLLLQTTGAGDVASLDIDQSAFSGDLVDGVVIVSWRVPLAFARHLAAGGVPVVLVDSYRRPRGFNWVSSEDRQGAIEATLHLTRLGHRHIGFVGGGEEAYLARERLAGFEEGLRRAGIDPAGADVVHGDFTREGGRIACLELLNRRPHPTAVFAASDLMAFGVLEALSEHGLRVPGDVSVVGFDGIPSSGHLTPALTTVGRPYPEMGATAVRLLHETNERPRQVDLPTSLVVRESTAPARTEKP